jgi:hypothetical protein
VGLSAKELAELNGEAISPDALAELNDEAPVAEVGPFADGYKLPPAKEAPPETFSDGPFGGKTRTLVEHTRNALERQRGREYQDAIASREAHDFSGGFSDEAKGVAGGVEGAIRATGNRMRSDVPIDPNAQFDEFGNQIGGATSAAAAGGYLSSRDADRAEQEHLSRAHPIATGLTDLGSGVAPGATARLAAQGLGDSEATTAVGLGWDAAKGLGAAVATKLLGWGAGKAAGKVGKAVADKVAPEAEEATSLAAKAKAAMTPETLRNVRAEQAIQEGVRVNGRKLGEVGTTRVNGAPLGKVPTVPGGATPVAVAPVGVGGGGGAGPPGGGGGV